MMEWCWVNFLVIVIITFGTCLTQDVTYYLDEERPNMTFVGNIGNDSNLLSEIGDTDPSLIFSFISTGRQYSQYFSLNEQTSNLFTRTVIDREQVCEFMEVCMLSLQVAVKSTLGSFFRILKVNVYIKDLNDHSPVFDIPSLILPISETVLVGTSFAIEGARDKDTSPEFSLKSYEIEGSESLEKIGIPFTVQFVKHLDGSSTVRLFVTEPLDREKIESYDIEIIAKDGATPPRTGTLPVHINITDENDNPPMFSSATYYVNITETFPVFGTIITLNAVDPDYGNNGRVGYRFSPLQSADNFRYFTIDETTGKISTKEKIVYSPGKKFSLIVEAFDFAPESSRLTSQTMVVVEIENEGNTPPQIKISILSGAEVSELANIGTVVAYVRIEDHDSGRQGIVGCIIESINFDLEPIAMNQYKVVVSSQLDYEKRKTQNVTVHCQDDGMPPLQASQTFIATTLDENDHSPIFMQSYYSLSVRENVPVGQILSTVNVTDYDTGLNSKVYFEVSHDVRDIFYFDNFTTPPNFANLRINKTLDREDKSSYLFPVYAIDKGHPAKTGTATISLYLTDVNDENPVFTEEPFHLSVREHLPANIRIGNLTAFDSDLGINAQVLFEIHPEDGNSVPFSVSRDGVVRTKKDLDREEHVQYEFRVLVADRGVPTLSSTGTVIVRVTDVNDNSPMFEFPTNDNDTISIPYSTITWQVVAKVRATDLDEIGNANSQLKYDINDRNDSNHFQIHPKSGEVQLIQELESSYTGEVYKLDILVSDFGRPVERSTLSPLFIRIVSPNITETHTASDSLTGKNFIIIIIIGAVTVVLSLGILITICLIGKIDRQRKQDQRNKSIDMNVDPDSKPFDGSITVFSLPSEDSLINDKRKKEVSFSLEDDVFSDDDLLQKTGTDRKNNHYRVSSVYLTLLPHENQGLYCESEII